MSRLCLSAVFCTLAVEGVADALGGEGGINISLFIIGFEQSKSHISRLQGLLGQVARIVPSTGVRDTASVMLGH